MVPISGELSVPLTFSAAVAAIYPNSSDDNGVASITAGGTGAMLEGLVKPGQMSDVNIATKWSGISVTEDDLLCTKNLPRGEYTARWWLL
ncbi:hypothetical protein ACLBR5_32735 [Escherichia coli]